jgi:histidinol-phosphate aminotransferase
MAQTPHIHQGIAGLRPYQPGKPIDELARELGLDHIVKLASNENPRGPGERVQQAMHAEFASLSRYPDGNGYILKQALVKHIGVQTGQITLGNGSNDVLDLIARVTVEPGCEAVISEHSFVVYRLAVTIAGGQLIEVPAQNFGTDLEAMAAAITPKTTVVFVANPNNPTGTWVTHQAFKTFLDTVPEHVWVVLDEAYLEYADHPDYPDGLALLAAYPNLILTRTFSKIHGLAALRVGYGLSSVAFADLLNRARQPFNVGSLGLAAAAAALDDQEFVATSVSLNKQGMAQIITGLTELGLEYIPSMGNFVSFNAGRNGTEVFQALLQQGVIVRPIAEYGLPDHVRVSIGLAEENQRFLDVLPSVI